MSASHHLSPGQWRKTQRPTEQLDMFKPAGEIYDNYPTVDVPHMTDFLGTDDLPYFDRKAAEDGEFSRDTNSLIMDVKLREATDNPSYYGDPVATSLRDNIKSQGIQRPVQLHQTSYEQDPPSWAKGWLGNGGHRVAVAADIDARTEVPVLHSREFRWAHDIDRKAERYAGWDSPAVRREHGESM